MVTPEQLETTIFLDIQKGLTAFCFREVLNRWTSEGERDHYLALSHVETALGPCLSGLLAHTLINTGALALAHTG